MNISIFGALGQQNLGDELILKNIISQIELGHIFPLKRSEQISFRAFTYDTKHPFFIKENISYQEYFPHHIKNTLFLFKNIKNIISFFTTLFWSDFIIIGGGGLFYDSELQLSKSNLKLWKWRTRMIKYMSKKIIFYGVSIDIKQDENKEFIHEIFSGAFKIFVRDSSSQEFLNSLGIQSKEIWDPVFYDRGELVTSKNLLKSFQRSHFVVEDIQDISFKDKIVGLAFRSGYFGNHDEKKLVQDLIDFLINHGAKKIILLPMSFHQSDYVANDRYFLEQFLSSTVSLGGESMQEVYEVFTSKKVDLCFAMRLHSIILSHVYEIPYIALSYAQKTDETLKKLS